MRSRVLTPWLNPCLPLEGRRWLVVARVCVIAAGVFVRIPYLLPESLCLCLRLCKSLAIAQCLSPNFLHLSQLFRGKSRDLEFLLVLIPTTAREKQVRVQRLQSNYSIPSV